MHPRSSGQRVRQVFIGKALLDQRGIARSLHVADAHEDRLGRLHPESVDDLGAQPSQDLRLHQHHALVVEPDAAIAEREMQGLREVVKGRRRAGLELAARALPLKLTNSNCTTPIGLLNRSSLTASCTTTARQSISPSGYQHP